MDNHGGAEFLEEDGGPGSGNFGHAGRPGKRGGSAKEGTGGGGESTGTSTASAAIERFKQNHPGARQVPSGGSVKGSTGPEWKTKPSGKEVGQALNQLRRGMSASELGLDPDKMKNLEWLTNGELSMPFESAKPTEPPKLSRAEKAAQKQKVAQAQALIEKAKELPELQNRESRIERYHGEDFVVTEKPDGDEIIETPERYIKGVNKVMMNSSLKNQAQICKEKAKKWPAGSEERHIYDMYAETFSKPLSGRPTPEQSKALTEKYLGNISKQLKPYAVERYKKDLANEPQITSDLCDIAEGLGTDMFGLDYRLKKASDSSDGGCRIADKIQENMEHEGWSYEEATDNLSDMVRYTQGCTTDNLVSNFEHTRAELEKKGYKVAKIKNTWDSYNIDKPYRGINCVFISPTGTRFELQFHTPESLVGKEVQHPQYEEQRKPDTPQHRKDQLGQIMYQNMSSMTAPKDIVKILNYPAK